MNKKILLFGFIFILLSSFGLADLTTDNEDYYSFDTGNYSGTNIWDLSGNAHNLTSSNVVLGTNTGIINYSIDFNGADAWAETPAVTLSDEFSINFWINPDDTGVQSAVMSTTTGSNDWGIYHSPSGDDKIAIYKAPTTALISFSGANALSVDSWVMITIVRNSSDHLLYYENGSYVGVGDKTLSTDFNFHQLGRAYSDNEYFDGQLDEIGLWDRALNSTEILEIYNNNTAGYNIYNIPSTPTPTVDTYIDLYNETPTDATTFTTNQVDFNITLNASNTTNCSLYVNDVNVYSETSISAGNETLVTTTQNLTTMTNEYYWFCESNATLNDTTTPKTLTLEIINLSSPTPLNDTQHSLTSITFSTYGNNTINYSVYCRVNLNYSNGTNTATEWTNYAMTYLETPPNNMTNKLIERAITFTESTTLNYSITCRDSTYTNINYTTPTNTIYIDYVYPAIDDSFTNLSFYYVSNITGQFNFTDDFSLFSWNISIDGNQIAGEEDVLNTFAQYNLSIDPQSLSVGEHTLSVRAADGHTAKELGGNFKVSDGLFNNYLKYEFYDEGYARVQGEGFFDRWETTRALDRYTFNYIPSDKKKNKHVFIVDSDLPIHIINAPNTKWKEWLVIGNHWFDFYMIEDVGKVSFKRLNDYEVEVTLKDITKPDKLKFSSIGDLNIVYANYTFYTINMTTTHSDIVNEKELTTFSLNITKGGYTGSSAILEYNNTNYTMTRTDMTTYYLFEKTLTTPTINETTTINFSYYYNLTGITNLTGNLSYNQTVYQIMIDNCSTYGMKAINFSLKNQSSLSLVTGDIEGYFKIWLEDEDNYRDFNLTWDNIQTGAMCIFPNESTYNIYGQIEYSIPTSDTFNYYLTNITINNVTNFIDLYITDDTTEVTLSVTDENDDPVEGAYISVLRYDLPTNSYVTTEIIKVDSEGLGIANLILTTQWYKFIITYDNVIYLETSPIKILTSTYNFQIVLGSDYYEQYTLVQGITCNVAFSNATDCFTYTVSDPTGASNTYCLDLNRRTLNSNTLINTSCSTGSTAAINLCILENTSDYTYEGRGYVTIDSTTFTCDSTEISYNTGFRKYGEEGLFATFLITLTLVMIGIWSPIISVILMVIAIILSIVMGIFQLTWGVMVGFIILAIITIYKMNQR